MDTVFSGKIGVLAGGSSSERDISLNSGRAVFAALKRKGLNACFLDVKNEEDAKRQISASSVSFAFIALHGRFGEDGNLQSELKRMKIPYTGSGPEASAKAIDKIISRQIFVNNDLPVPEYEILSVGQPVKKAGLPFPLVVKPRTQGSSIGLSVVTEAGQYDRAVELAFKYDDKIIAEKFIAGEELTVGVLGGEPLPVIKIVPAKGCYDYKAKYESPDTEYVVPAPLEKDKYGLAQDMGIRAHKALGCKAFSRTDMMLDKKGNFYVLEVNTIPGLTERSLLPMAAGENGTTFEDLCVKMIELSLEDTCIECREVDFRREGRIS
jgi:D-alanine-D-alanine ligase